MLLFERSPFFRGSAAAVTEVFQVVTAVQSPFAHSVVVSGFLLPPHPAARTTAASTGRSATPPRP
jgi:hypothetical protein